MTALTNAKHEKFAQGLAQRKSQADSYKAAGYKFDAAAASRLSRNIKILDRVAELTAAASMRVEVTLASLIKEAGEIQEAAKGAQQYSAATAALTAKAKLAGLWIDKSDNQNTNRNLNANDATDQQLLENIERERQEREQLGGIVPAPPDSRVTH